MADPSRFKFEGTGYYVKSPQEMRAISADADWQAACDATLLIAERAEVGFEKRNLMPLFPLPDGETEESWLRQEVWRGMERRYPDGYRRERPRSRAEYEMGIIEAMGFCSYFLVVADFIMWAKRNGIRVGPGRGSAAGSIIAYALGITDLDPMAHGLIFERFLNPERVSMPDIDIDFDERRRGDVIRYVTEKYGDDRVAQIITYGTIKAKAAVKDSARVLGFPYALGDRITKAFPPAVMGKDMPLSGIFDPDHPRYGEAGEIRALYEAEAEVRQVIDTARGLEGLIRQAGVHAAGVIMSSEPLLDHIPVWKREADGAIITQFDYPSCEDLGLLKMDFLGLRNLTVLDDALAAIRSNQGQHVTWRRCRWTTSPPTTCSPAATRSASSSSTAARCGHCCGPCARTGSPTSRPSTRCTGRARWARTRTTTTPTARWAASRSSPFTPSWPSRWPTSSGTPTG